jgi:hypothetical protein
VTSRARTQSLSVFVGRVGGLIGAFLDAESTYLLGLEKKGVRVRQSLRRIGDLILMKEGDSSNR